uniref:Uncharacterized protein n=1 Tax=Glossina pallidipes TaxID=7398 RepID=A0A1B0A4D4_GLOPL
MVVIAFPNAHQNSERTYHKALLLHTAALALTDNCRRVDGLRSTERNDPALLTNLDAATSGVSSSISRTQDTESVFSITPLTTGDEGEISFCLSSRTQRKLSASLCKREISILAIELLFLGELLTALSFKLRREVRSTANSSCDKFSLSFNSRSLFSLIARSWSSSLESNFMRSFTSCSRSAAICIRPAHVNPLETHIPKPWKICASNKFIKYSLSALREKTQSTRKITTCLPLHHRCTNELNNCSGQTDTYLLRMRILHGHKKSHEHECFYEITPRKAISKHTETDMLPHSIKQIENNTWRFWRQALKLIDDLLSTPDSSATVN